MSCEWPLRRVQAVAEGNVLLRRLARARRLLSRLASATALAPTTALPAVLRHTAFAVGQTVFGFSPYGYVPLYKTREGLFGAVGPFYPPPGRGRTFAFELLHGVGPLSGSTPTGAARGGVREGRPHHNRRVV